MSSADSPDVSVHPADPRDNRLQSLYYESQRSKRVRAQMSVAFM